MKKEKLKKQSYCYQQPTTKHRTQSGITLVALVITIIILLILAGIGISLITGGEGIFQKTDITAKEHKKASMIEVVETAKTELLLDALIDGTEINLENLIKKIKEISEINEKDYIITDIEKDEVTGTESVTIIDKKTGVVIDIWMDINGNIRVEGTIVDDISKVTKPTITYTLDPAEGYAETVTIKITVTEEKNGVIKVQLPDNTVKTYNNEKTIEIEYPVNENGTYPITAVGGNGRTTTKYIQVKNAMSAADIEITNLNEGIASKDTVEVKIKYDENVRVGGKTLTNEDRYQYKIENGEWQTAESNEVTIPVDVNGTVLASYYDGTDRYKTATLTINNIDKEKPTVNSFSVTEVTTYSIKVEASATDEGSEGTAEQYINVRGYKYRIDNGSWSEETEETSYTFNDLTQETSYTIRVIAIDMAGNESNEKTITVTTEKATDGSFSVSEGLNTPDVSNLPTETTKYITWTGTSTYTEVASSTVPENWYDYDNGQWANIKTTSTDASLEAYWVWIPRFAYKMPETTGNGDEKQIEVIFVKNNSKTGANGETCYYSTDTEITSDGSGLYVNKTDNAMNEWIIHPAFTFGDDQLNGIWFAKFEASSSNPSASYGGGNVTNLKVQVKSGVTSWRDIRVANAWEVCRAIQETGGALGTAIDRNDTTATIDTHMAKNMDWGAVAALSQSKYGIYNPKSATGLTANGGDNTLRVWNNPNSSYITGTVGSAADAASIADASCTRYNTGNGPKGSSTGTVYGVYDMAGGAAEYVMGVLELTAGSGVPNDAWTGFSSSNPWPNAKYYDLYAGGWTYTDAAAYNRGKIGDLTRELAPVSGKTWNQDGAAFPNASTGSNSFGHVFLRDTYSTGTADGVFGFGREARKPGEYSGNTTGFGMLSID